MQLLAFKIRNYSAKVAPPNPLQGDFQRFPLRGNLEEEVVRRKHALNYLLLYNILPTEVNTLPI